MPYGAITRLKTLASGSCLMSARTKTRPGGHGEPPHAAAGVGEHRHRPIDADGVDAGPHERHGDTPGPAPELEDATADR